MAENNTAATAATGAESAPMQETAQQDTGAQSAEQKTQDAPFDFPPPQEGAAQGNVASQATNEGGQTETLAIPEKYEFHLPEGLTLTPEVESKFTEIAKGAKLTQEQTDALIELHSELMLGAMKQAEMQKNAWVEECHKAGLSAPEKLRAAKLAVDSFDETGKVMQELIDSGLAYSPNVQRFLQLIGSYLEEDTAPDSKPAAQAKSAADLLFGNSKYN